MPLYKSLIFFILLLVSSSSNLAFRYVFFFSLKCPLASRLTLLGLDHVSTAFQPAFFDVKNLNILHQTMVYCCFNSCKPGLSLAEVLMFSLMFSQDLLKNSSPLKFSKAVNLFVISIWYCFLISSSFNFLRLFTYRRSKVTFWGSNGSACGDKCFLEHTHV